MKFENRAFFVIITAFILTACYSKARYAQIPRSQLETYISNANHGDAEAARKLSRHFLFGLNDLVNGKIWLTRAAELGDRGACMSLTDMGEKAPETCASRINE